VRSLELMSTSKISGGLVDETNVDFIFVFQVCNLPTFNQLAANYTFCTATSAESVIRADWLFSKWFLHGC